MSSKNYQRPNIGENVESKESMPNGRSFEIMTQSGRPITAVQLDNEFAAVNDGVEKIENIVKDVTAGILPGVNESSNKDKVLFTDGEGNMSWDNVRNKTLADKSITQEKVADNSIKEKHIDGSAVTADKIKNKAVTEDKFADDSIKSAFIKTGAVTNEKLAAHAVTEGNIADDSITTAKIKDEQITEDKLAANSITTSKIKDGAVSLIKIADTTANAWADKIKPDVEPNANTIPKRDGEGSLKGKNFIYSDEEDDLEDLSSVIVCKDDKKSVPLKFDNFKEHSGITALEEDRDLATGPYYRLSPNQEGDVKDNELVGFVKNTDFQIDFEVIRTTVHSKEWTSRDTEEQAIFNAMGIQPPHYQSFNIIKVKWSGWTNTKSGWLFYNLASKNSGYITSACYAKLISGTVGNYLFEGITNDWSLCGEVHNSRLSGYIHPHPLVTSETGEVHFFLPAVIAGKFPLDKNKPSFGWLPYNPNIDDETQSNVIKERVGVNNLQNQIDLLTKRMATSPILYKEYTVSNTRTLTFSFKTDWRTKIRIFVYGSISASYGSFGRLNFILRHGDSDMKYMPIQTNEYQNRSSSAQPNFPYIFDASANKNYKNWSISFSDGHGVVEAIGVEVMALS